MTSALTSIFWFVVVLAMIPLALWLLKRSPALRGAAMSARAGGLRHVAAMPLSASQRIVTVEVGAGDSRCWLVLGVTPGSITTLHTMMPTDRFSDDGDDSVGGSPPAEMQAPPTAFAQLLRRLQGGGR